MSLSAKKGIAGGGLGSGEEDEEDGMAMGEGSLGGDLTYIGDDA